MKYIYEGKNKEGIKDFDLDHIFDCGQCFRWAKEEDGSYTGIAMGKVVNMQVYEKESVGADDEPGSTDAGGAGIGGNSGGGAARCKGGNAGGAGIGGNSGGGAARCVGGGSDAGGAAGGNVVDGANRRAHAGGKLVLEIDNCCEDDFNRIWYDYLDMGRDYGAIKNELSQRDEDLKRIIPHGSGIRILKQDLWETIVSFIISQNNNIPRIKGCIENLCGNFGEKAGNYRGKDFYNIPSPEVMASLTAEDLAPCRLGYRAPYLIETAGQVLAKGGIGKVAAELAELETPEETYEYLRQFKGIGPKVANCIALFGLSRVDAFPIDVWVRRVMNSVYGFAEKDVKTMSEYARTAFGEYGGIAQQYLFYYIRGQEE